MRAKVLRKRGKTSGMLHLDKRADKLIEAAPDCVKSISDLEIDPQLTPEQMMKWLNCGDSTLEQMRAKGIGPPWVRLSNRLIRYSYKGTIQYLKDRAQLRITGYGNKPKHKPQQEYQH